MRCCAPGCKNDSRVISKSKGITFHVFPSVPSLKTKWVEAIGKDSWKPQKRSSLCSEHFLPEDLYETKNGMRKVRFGALPIVIQDPDSEDDDPDALQVCRICLAVDCKMFSIRKFKLEQSFENLTGSEVNREDKFPQKLCYICFRRLVNCARLRAQSLKAECLMMEIMRKQDLTYENIKAINREKNLLTPNLAPKHFESNHYDLFLEDDRTNEINFDNTFSNEVFLEEFDARMDTEINESADGYSSDDSLPLEVSKRKKEMEESEKMKAGDDDKRKGDELKCLVCAQSFKEEFDYYSHVANHTEHPVVVTENQITIEFDRKYYEPNVEENDPKDDELEELSLVIDTERKGDDDLKLEQILDDYVASEKDYSSDDSTLQEVKKKKEQKKLKKKPQKNKEPKIDRRRKPFLSDDLNETLFTIIDLTYEEQVAEIEKRQESSNFKNAVFKCMECYKGFLDEDAYNSHMLRHTDECGVHRCDVCKTHFRHPHALRKHITAHHTQRFSCKQCPYVTAHRQSARLHERWHKGTKYACPHCPDEFLKFTTYMGHIRIKHPSDFVCQLCGYSFVSEKGIALHKKLKHRQENAQIPEDGPTCDLCNIRFVDTDAYKRHISVSARHNPVDKESPCNIRFVDTDAYKRHISVSARHNPVDKGSREPNKPPNGRKSRETKDRERRAKDRREKDEDKLYPSQMRKAEGPIPCEQCGVQLEDSRAYHGHFRRMHPDKNRTKYPSMKSPCMCELCGRMFQKPRGVQLEDSRAYHGHFRRMHPDKNRTKYPSMKSPCMCELCGRMFQSYALLKDHRWTHTGERPFKCDSCDKSFRMKQRLVAHRRVHSAHKPSYVCGACGKQFSTHSNRQRHMFIHTGLKPFKCEMCGKGFKHASEKRAHITYVHLKKPWPKRSRGKRRDTRPIPMQQVVMGPEDMPLQSVWPCDPKMQGSHHEKQPPTYYALKM